jgi:glycosyltransferase involved in cell wall biosynthesis
LFYNWNAPSLASASRSLACKLLVDEHGSRQNTNLTSRPDKWLHYQLVFRRVIWPKVNRPDTTFVAIGLEERDLLCAATGMDPARVHVIWLGADLTAFKFDETGRRRVRQSLGLSEASVVVLHAGKLSPRKDPEVLLRAWQKVVAQAPDARLLMLAGGEAGYVDSVKRLAGELCISGSVTWHGLAPHDELPDYLSAADIGVWPGDYSNVIQEALACRVPVVLASPETGGHSVNRVLLSAGNGLGFPRGDHEALARCLLEMITSPSRRQEMSSRGEALARSKFDWAAISQQFVELYQGQSTV